MIRAKKGQQHPLPEKKKKRGKQKQKTTTKNLFLKDI